MEQPTATDSATSTEPDHRLKEDLDGLLAAAAGAPITFRQMLETLGERSQAILLLIIATPFIIIPIPGVSTVFGVVLVVLGLSIALRRKPWLPEFICRRELSNQTLTRLVRGTGGVLRRVEWLFRPRLPWAFHPTMHFIAGVSLVMLAVAFSLPIPIPWNNGPPAIGILILALGILERDGLMVLVGIIYNAILWIVLVLLSGLIMKGIAEAWGKLQHLFG